MHYKGGIVCALAMSAISLSSAQSRNSFQLVSSLTGLSSTLNGLQLDTTLDIGSTFVYQSLSYTIADVFGIWLLDDSDDFLATGANSSPWSYNANYASTGGIAGWKTNPNTGITPGNSQSLTYTAINGTAEHFGYHVRVTSQLPGGDDTLFIQGQPVPEPATLAVLGVGALALARRRRNR